MEEIPRHQYLAELDEWRDETDIVKVILGVRRSGKSVVMANTVGDCLNLMFHQKTWLYDNLSGKVFSSLLMILRQTRWDGIILIRFGKFGRFGDLPLRD